jgi:hypothetical protein
MRDEGRAWYCPYPLLRRVKRRDELGQMRRPRKTDVAGRCSNPGTVWVEGPFPAAMGFTTVPRAKFCRRHADAARRSVESRRLEAP